MKVGDFWNSLGPEDNSTDSILPDLGHLDEPVQRYLRHAFGTQTSKFGAVRLEMNGEILLDRWHRFKAEQVIAQHRGIIWAARTSMKGLPVSGFDQVIDGKGHVCWKILGLFTAMEAKGPHVDRSAAGRFAGEHIWLPSAFLAPNVRITSPEENLVVAEVRTGEEATNLQIRIDAEGRVQSVLFPRWYSEPPGEPHYKRFGGVVTAERTFDGYTIPSELEMGWLEDDEPGPMPKKTFFRCQITSAEFKRLAYRAVPSKTSEEL